jgi:hypothetical protein
MEKQGYRNWLRSGVQGFIDHTLHFCVKGSTDVNRQKESTILSGFFNIFFSYRFYTGKFRHIQKPLNSFKIYFSYTIKPKMRLAFDATCYSGGNTNLNGIDKNDCQQNFCNGGPFVFRFEEDFHKAGSQHRSHC